MSVIACHSCRKKKDEVALQWAQIRMVTWMCDVKVKIVPSRVESKTRIR